MGHHTQETPRKDTMNKKLGAIALLGASAVVLAGCAAIGRQRLAHHRPAPQEIRVWLVGTDTPRGGARLPQGDLRGREPRFDA